MRCDLTDYASDAVSDRGLKPLELDEVSIASDCETFLAPMLFTARQHSLLSDVCTSYRKSVRLSVCLSVCHTLALCQNDSSYDHGVFTGG